MTFEKQNDKYRIKFSSGKVLECKSGEIVTFDDTYSYSFTFREDGSLEKMDIYLNNFQNVWASSDEKGKTVLSERRYYDTRSRITADFTIDFSRNVVNACIKDYTTLSKTTAMLVYFDPHSPNIRIPMPTLKNLPVYFFRNRTVCLYNDFASFDKTPLFSSTQSQRLNDQPILTLEYYNNDYNEYRAPTTWPRPAISEWKTSVKSDGVFLTVDSVDIETAIKNVSARTEMNIKDMIQKGNDNFVRPVAFDAYNGKVTWEYDPHSGTLTFSSATGAYLGSSGYYDPSWLINEAGLDLGLVDPARYVTIENITYSIEVENESFVIRGWQAPRTVLDYFGTDWARGIQGVYKGVQKSTYDSDGFWFEVKEIKEPGKDTRWTVIVTRDTDSVYKQEFQLVKDKRGKIVISTITDYDRLEVIRKSIFSYEYDLQGVLKRQIIDVTDSRDKKTAKETTLYENGAKTDINREEYDSEGVVTKRSFLHFSNQPGYKGMIEWAKIYDYLTSTLDEYTLDYLYPPKITVTRRNLKDPAAPPTKQVYELNSSVLRQLLLDTLGEGWGLAPLGVVRLR